MKVKFKYDEYDIRWCQSIKEVDFTTFKKGKQLVNKIPNLSRVYSSRQSMIYTLKNKESEIKQKFNLYVREFLPESYNLDILHDLKAFLESAS